VRILYHHRTQAEDAQGIHIYEILRAFRELGHEVKEVALVPAENGPHTSARNKPKGGGWSIVSRMVPSVVYELMEMAYNPIGYLKLRRAIRSFRPDFLYERYSLYTACGIWAARRAGLPLILEINAPLALEQERAGKLTFKRFARRAERWIASHASRAIVVSTPMKRILEELGVPSERLAVICNGVDPEQFSGKGSGDTVRERYGLADRPVLGFVGWVREWHGLAELARGMGSWTGAMGEAALLVVGDGPARPAIEKAAEQAGVADRVQVTGPVPRAEMADHIAAFDVALQPAATPYASPMKVFEYLAMGKPVVACRQKNLEEILTQGRDALFFEPGDWADLARAARDLLSDEARLRRMSDAARKTIFDRNYLWRENAARAVALAEVSSAGS